jgi:AraC family transcriptional activator of tynA and feaB
MVISETIQIGSRAHDGLFDDWRRELQKYVLSGFEFFSPRKHIFAEWAGFHFAGARMIRLNGRGSVRQLRAKPHPSRRYSPIALFQLRGSVSIRQFRREGVIGPGMFALCDLATPFEMQRDGEWELLSVEFPPSALQQSAFRQATAIPMSASSAVDRPLFETVRNFWDAAPHFQPSNQWAMLDALRTMTLLTSSFQRGAEEHTHVRVDRAMAFIDQNLDDEFLCAQKVAHSQGVSRRYLDECFARSGTSIDAYIWDLRVRRAAEQLVQSSLSDKSVLQIALDLGFKCPSHFSKAFSSRYGMPPREYRRRAMADRRAAPLLESQRP